MEKIRKFVLCSVLVLVLALLGGCSMLGGMLEKNYKMAQQLDEACQSVGDLFVLPTNPDAFSKQLVARVRLRLTGAACKPGDNSCMNDSLYFRRDRLSEQLEDFQVHLKREKPALEPILESLRDSRIAINDQFKVIDKGLDDMGDRLSVVVTKQCVSRRACAKAIIETMRTLGFVLSPDASNSPLFIIRAKYALIRVSLNQLRTTLVTDAPQLADELARIMDEADAVLHLAVDTARAIALDDAPAVAEQVLFNNAKYQAAQRALRFFESSLRPVDRLIDQADSRFFLFPTVFLTVGEGGVQEQFDKFYDYLVSKPLKDLDLQLAFAKASCDRLSDGSNSNSQMMPFVFRMFAKGIPKHLDKQFLDNHGVNREKAAVAVANGLGPCRPADDEKRKDVTLADDDIHLVDLCTKIVVSKEMAGDDGRTKSGTATGITAVDGNSINVGTATGEQLVRKGAAPYTDVEAYQLCYMTQVQAMAQQSMAGLPPDAASSREAGASACGAVIDRKRVRDPGSVSLRSQNSSLTVDGISTSTSTSLEWQNETRFYVRQYYQQIVILPPEAPVNHIPPIATNLCQNLGIGNFGSIRCETESAELARMGVESHFGRGMWQDEVMVERLEAVAERISRVPGKLTVKVQGFASVQPMSCLTIAARLNAARHSKGRTSVPFVLVDGAGNTVSGKRPKEGKVYAQRQSDPAFKTSPSAAERWEFACAGGADEGNVILAAARAQWAADVLTRRGRGRVEAEAEKPPNKMDQLSYESRADRRISIAVSRANGAKTNVAQ